MVEKKNTVTGMNLFATMKPSFPPMQLNVVIFIKSKVFD